MVLHYTTAHLYITIPHRKVTYPPTNGSLSLMQIFFIVFLFVFFFCHLLPSSYDTAIQLLPLSVTGGISTAYCKCPMAYYIPKKKKQQNIKFNRLHMKPDIISRDVKTITKVHIFKRIIKYIWKQPVSVAARSKAWVCGRSLAGIAGSNPAGL